MDHVITPEPHLIPGYTGHCPQYRQRVGKTYGKLTNKLLIDPCLNHAPELIVSPLTRQKTILEYPTQKEIQTLRFREQFVDPVYLHPIIPGYSGFVPNITSKTGKRFMAAASAGVAEHETLMELLRCERRTLIHRDLLESGAGIFDHKLGERMLPMTYYRAPLLPVKPRAQSVQMEQCDYKPGKLRYSKFTVPHFMDDDDEDKFIINGYAGHIPMALTRFGECNKQLTHNALCGFSKFMYNRKLDKWCPMKDSTDTTISCPKTGQFEIYHKDMGMVPSYMGHVPGSTFKFGSTYGMTTYDAKNWLELHKQKKPEPNIDALLLS